MRAQSLVLTAVCLAAVPAAASAGPEVDILHFWISPSESAALRVFETDFVARGGQWHATALPDYKSVRSAAAELIADGFPPTAMQWTMGPVAETMIDLDLIQPLDRVMDVAPFVDDLLPAVRDFVSRNGAISVIPVGVHGENWAWYNAGVYRDLGLTPPTDWEGFLEQAPVIAAAGHLPLAMGRADWERRILLTIVMVGEGGGAFYERVLGGEPLTDPDRAVLARSVAIFQKLSRLVDPGFETRAWNEATRMVIDGAAAAQIMGDWAKGEFLAADKTSGQDFHCAMAPGSGSAYVMVVDVFALARSDDPQTRAAQAALAQTILDPANQAEFVRLKGALPVRQSVDVAGLDECARRGWAVLREPANQFRAPGLVATNAVEMEFTFVAEKIWRASDMPPETGAALLEAGMARLAAR